MKPIQYQRGWVEFYKLRFKVTSDTLIPRPETELLVDEVLNFVNALDPKPYTLNPVIILDIGTGAGNIAISIAKNLSPTSDVGARTIATDISEKALEIARQNAKLNGIQNKIEFLQSDLLSAINYTLDAKRYTLILVTNLPYIPTERIAYLDSSVKDFEPHMALDGGEDGFELYRKLFKQVSLTPERCKPKLIVGEIDYTHGELARNEALKYFPNTEVEIKTDLAHKQRILKITG